MNRRRFGVENEPQPLPTELFPKSVATSWSRAHPPGAGLRPAEDRLTASMSPRRRKAFVHGRVCGHSALAKLGVQADAIGIGAGGQPLWPEETVGSISHKAGWAAAAVAWRSQFVSLGLDIEPVSALGEDVLRLISRPEERTNPFWRQTWSNETGWSVLFSIKESVYKCLWPLLERYIDFQDIEISIDETGPGFTARSHSETVPAELAVSLRGRFLIEVGVITSAAWIHA